MRTKLLPAARLILLACVAACLLPAAASASLLWNPSGVAGDGAASWAWFIDWQGVSVGVCKTSGQAVHCSTGKQTGRLPRGKNWVPAGVSGDAHASIAWFANDVGSAIAACRADETLTVACSDAHQSGAVGSPAA